jgi:type IV secretion system protein VirB6
MQAYVESIFLTVDKVTENYVYNGFSALVDQVNLVLAPLLILAVIFQGYKIWFSAEMKLNDFWYFTLRIGLIEGIGLTWSTFSKLFMGTFQSIIDSFGSALLSANPIHIPGVSSINMSLQLTSNVIGLISSAIFGQAGIYHLSLFFYGSLVWCVGYAMVGLAMVEMILAKFMMAALFTIAPIIAIATLFKPTRGMFDRWLGNLLGFTMLLIMISVMLGMTMGILYTFMPITAVTDALPDSFFKGLAIGLVPMLICLFLSMYCMFKISQLAMHIGGGACSAGIGAVVGGMMVGAMMGAGAKAGGKGMDLAKSGGKAGAKAITGKLKSSVKAVRKRFKV